MEERRGNPAAALHPSGVILNEHTIPVRRALAAVLWVVTWAFLIAGWTVYLCDYSELGIMLLLSSLPPAWTACLLTIRCWFGTFGRLVRLTAGGPVEAPFR